MPRTNLSAVFTPEQRATQKPKIIARNTFRYSDNTDTVIRLHQTDIVRKHANGKVTLNSGGWKTYTTKDRMSYHMPAGFDLIADKGIWYVVKGARWSKESPRVAFYDGIVVPDCFDKPAKSAKVEAAELKLRASIRKFVAKLDKCEELPQPSTGDCWFCCLRDANTGQPWGDEQSHHLLSHVKEGYLHGSLLVNAMRHVGFTDYRIASEFQMWKRDRQSSGRRDPAVKRALKRYLYAKLGLSVQGH